MGQKRKKPQIHKIISDGKWLYWIVIKHIPLDINRKLSYPFIPNKDRLGEENTIVLLFYSEKTNAIIAACVYALTASDQKDILYTIGSDNELYIKSNDDIYTDEYNIKYTMITCEEAYGKDDWNEWIKREDRNPDNIPPIKNNYTYWRKKA